MSRKRMRGALPLALIACFVAGVLVDGWFRRNGPPKPVQPEAIDAFLAAPARPKEAPVPAPATASAPTAVPTTAPAPASPPAATIAAGSNPHLRIPIDGETIESWKGGFAERRGDRPHDAVDILAPRNTPVHAVENGTVAKLFTSRAGGLTIYQFDPTGHLCYYYAHLDRYADGLADGQAVTQGDVIGYVGTTGNAPPNTPHLHFGVFELNADRRWWQGKPLDPYAVFKDRG